MGKRRLILRADGNGKIGLGHVYRLLALADILQGMFDCYFAIDAPDSFVQEEIKKRNCTCLAVNNKMQPKLPDENEDEEEIDFDLGPYLDGSEIVVTDGYLFGKNYQLAVKATGAKLICIDDIAKWEFFADVVINHAPGIKDSLYKRQSYTEIFTGIDYAIIRKPFFRPLPQRIKYGSDKAFICLGGSDYFGYSFKLIEILSTFDRFNAYHIICSSSFSNELINNLKSCQTRENKIYLHFNVSAKELADVMDDCTHAFVSASTVLMESYSRGLMCFAGYYVNNQQYIYDGFIKNKWAIGLGNFQFISSHELLLALNKQAELNTIQEPLLSEHSLRNILNSVAVS
jgi:spore coat polysaccharide biosynthesis predicted glycosyltransferase SpsG